MGQIKWLAFQNVHKITNFKHHSRHHYNSCPGCQSTYIGKTDRTLFIRTHEHAISYKESAMYKHLHTCEHLIIFPDTLNIDNIPPVLTCNKEYFPQLVRNNTTVLDCDHNWNLLLFKEAYYIKCLTPLNNGIEIQQRTLSFLTSILFVRFVINTLFKTYLVCISLVWWWYSSYRNITLSNLVLSFVV